ncbi:MAG: cytochrome c oxidase subunit II [Alphaproteobacteria bacterium]|nr:cytochrome c oxidase subunit II [Alphaproteobacteria bacterium]
MIKTFLTLALATFVSFSGTPAFAGQPQPWQLGLQEPASPSALRIFEFHDMLLAIIFSIAIFVLLLLIWVIIRYNAKANPEPAQFSHNVLIEVLWTVIPIVILIIIAIPSFKVLYYNDRVENPDMTLKVTGYQWYWTYEYPDHDGLNFSSYMIADKDIDESKDQKRLLSTDNVVVLPIDTNIQILITAGDVIHSWAVPALGIKLDGVPGRLNETWVRIEKPGTYYGQCSELCGKDHSYMPIEIHAVTKEEFKNWLVSAKKEFAAAPILDSSIIQFAALNQHTPEHIQ